MAVRVHAVSILLTEAARETQSGASHTARLISSMAGVLAAELPDYLSRGAWRSSVPRRPSARPTFLARASSSTACDCPSSPSSAAGPMTCSAA